MSFNLRLYIFGGKDLGVGHLDTLWCLDLSDIKDLGDDEETQVDAEWQ